MIEMIAFNTLLIEYAAGSLSACESFMVSSLLALNPEAQKKLQEFEAVGGKAIREETPTPVSAACLQSVLAQIQQRQPAQKCTVENPIVALPPELAAAEKVRPLFQAHCGQKPLAWVGCAPGIRKIDLSICDHDSSRKKLRLMHMAPHAMTPPHRHRGSEITLVLQGSFMDLGGRYEAGDMTIIDNPAFIHAPKAGPEGCLCLTLTEAPLQFQSIKYRVLNIIFHI